MEKPKPISNTVNINSGSPDFIPVTIDPGMGKGGNLILAGPAAGHTVMTSGKVQPSKRKVNFSPYVAPAPKKAYKMRPQTINTVINNESGEPVDVILVPTKNAYDPLRNRSDEITMTASNNTPKKIRVPPITIFNCDSETVRKDLKTAGVTKYSIKHLKHGLHVYCEDVKDFKTVRESMKSGQAQYYSHELPDEKQFKVVLSGLHKMSPEDLLKELKEVKLEPTAVRVINPRNSANRSDVLYVVSFPRGSIKLNDLREHRIICYTRVHWEPYRHRGGIIQCSRCQRPGHGIKHCHMAARCGFCGDAHESKDCISTKTAAAKEAAGASTGPTEVLTPSKCCNCNIEGHFATDPNCPKRLEYVNARRRRNQGSGNNSIHPNKGQFIESRPTTYYDQHKGPTYAEVVSNPGFKLGPSGNSFPSGFKGHFDSSRPSGSTFPSSNLNNEPFSIEEITQLTFDIINSLQNVQFMPRQEAMMAVMNMAMKYLFKNGR